MMWRSFAGLSRKGSSWCQGRVSAGLLEQEQLAAHGLAWLTTYTTALRELLHWAERLEAGDGLGELETLMLQAGFGEYLAKFREGISPSEVQGMATASDDTEGA